MRKVFKKCIVACAAMCTIISATVFSVSATSYWNYNTNKAKSIKTCDNPTSWNYVINANTRPTAGTGGATVSYKTLNGTTTLASKTFPYYTNVSDLSHTLTPNQSLIVWIEPAASNQTIIGTLYLSD